MAYSEQLANRIREALMNESNVEEKRMMGGLCFMVNDKMCIGVMKDEMLCRISPEVREEALERPGCRVMNFTGRPMKGFVLVDDTAMKTQRDFEYWINMCLAFNPEAKSSRKK